jgi:transposase
MATFLVPRRSAIVRWRGTLEGLLPEQHPARFIWQVLSSLDFSELEDRYASVWAGPGRPPYHPRVLAALWIYGLSEGLETATGIAKACRIRDDFRWLTGGLSPSDQTLLNFLTGSEVGLASIWGQVLKSMHQAGHIDLSVIAEDGTKLRANASPRSFLTAPDIAAVVERLKAQIADKLREIANCSKEGQETEAQVELRYLRLRLSRAELAAQELDQRLQRCHNRGVRASGAATAASTGGASAAEANSTIPIPRFTWQDFELDPDHNVLICPAKQELRFIGQYRTDNGRNSYRLYGRWDCGACPLKNQCTKGRGRRTKIYLHVEVDPKPVALPATSCPTKGATIDNVPVGGQGEHPAGPRASITEPEAVMMLATSEKRWEPSYNADLAVTRHGVLVSQFLTKDTTDFHHFSPALHAVISAVGKPESWVGDGHYGTKANVLFADRQGVFLYAPPAWDTKNQDDDASAVTVEKVLAAPGSLDTKGLQSPTDKFGRHDFRPDPAHDVLVCPAEQELRLVGEYANDNGLGTYRLYSRSDCGDCSIKSHCTDARGRRVKVPMRAEDSPLVAKPIEESVVQAEQNLDQLLQALENRMKEVGDAVLRFRRETIEPANAHLKQHGVGRFHVHGLARCQSVLTLACIAHNLTKWKAREAARSLPAVA